MCGIFFYINKKTLLNHTRCINSLKVLNERGITTHKGSVWGGSYVYAVLKRYKERLERIKFRKMKYEPQFSKMWIEFTK